MENNNNNSNKNKESRSSSLTSSSTSVRNWEEVLQLPEEGRISSFLRILLVEADDSTRRLIAAHLRKSTYKVAAVSDGLEAWETLTKSPHDIDLILMETELPSISGYALLTLIMEHDSCKNIPVIMMSSCDSINLVLNCMLKGAADFLVKPVRRNELRNLWQHVWRKQTQTAVHVPQDTEDAHLNNENKGEKVSDIRMNRGGPYDLSNPGSGEECELVIPKNEFRDKSFTSGLEVSCIEAFNSAASILGEGADFAETMIKDEGEWSHSHSEDRNADELIEPSSAIDLIGKFENRPRDVNGDFDTFHDDEKFGFSPYLELSLEKFYPSCSRDMKVDEQHMLNHSYASAFSRYNNSMALKPLSSAVGNSFAESKEDSNICSYLDDGLVEKSFGASTQFGPASNNRQEIMVGHSELAEEECPGSQFGCIPSTESPFGSSGTGYDHSLPPVTYTQSGFLWSEIHNSEQGCGATINHSAERTMQEESNSGSAERLRHDSTVPGVDGNRSLYKSTATNRVCETICITVDGDATMVRESAKTTASESLKESHLHIGRVRMDSKCSAQREAALLKFRQKRKERCYDKKVRYQSRKRLAEQRPRVKGQFVRQMQTGPSADTDY